MEETPPPVELTREQLKGIIAEMRKNNLIRDRSHYFKKYPKVFVGSEAVAYFQTTPYASDVKEAEALGQRMLDQDLIHHVVDEHSFKNAFLFYRAREDDETGAKGLSVAHMLLTNTVPVHSWMDVRVGVFWYRRYCVLSSDNKLLYCYESNLSSEPAKVLDLNNVELEIEECECKSGSYCFTVIGKKKINFCADHSKIQLAWLKALTEELGLKFNEEIVEVKENSIFDFESTDIDGELVPLSQFAGKVCLVVNVASY
eukprot:TRINITY_DN7920_c0_g1_i1.p1 TRINITY_DN7920_c0_g1~~TRINITY_DN7920_c0_g1_i1.p1  ORF type:complete len:257 (+),score=75.03 TRINITY_DN7920_c0_g1_i1:56-826(+)